MTAPAVLVVEDDPGLRVLIARALQQNGFAVFQARSGPEMWNSLEARPVDLILLDIMLPGQSGIDLCRELRARSDTPIIFVSAKGDETDRVIGLELGADDYIPKPFGTRELLARVRAVLRRRAPATAIPTRRARKKYASRAGRLICAVARCCRRAVRVSTSRAPSSTCSPASSAVRSAFSDAID